MENKNDFSENDFLIQESDETLPVPNQPFEGESFEVSPDMENGESADRYYEVFEKSKTKSMAWSVASMVLGIVSVALSAAGIVTLILGILAITFAIISRAKLGYFDTKTIVGMILGIFGIVFGSAMIIINSAYPEGIFSSIFGNGGAGSGSSGGDISDI